MKEKFVGVMAKTPNKAKVVVASADVVDFLPKNFAATKNRLARNLDSNIKNILFEEIIDSNKVPDSIELTAVVDRKPVFDERRFFTNAGEKKTTSDFVKESSAYFSSIILRTIVDEVIETEDFKAM